MSLLNKPVNELSESEIHEILTDLHHSGKVAIVNWYFQSHIDKIAKRSGLATKSLDLTELAEDLANQSDLYEIFKEIMYEKLNENDEE